MPVQTTCEYFLGTCIKHKTLVLHTWLHTNKEIGVGVACLLHPFHAARYHGTIEAVFFVRMRRACFPSRERDRVTGCPFPRTLRVLVI